MDNAAWVKLIKQIPAEQQELLTFMTRSGIEISLQSVARVEQDHLVGRGRIAGTNDQDRVFLIPYDQIVYAGFQRALPPPIIMRIYGDVAAEPVPPPEAAPAPVEAPPPPPVVVEEPAPAPAKNPTKPKIAKAALLERIRARNEAKGEG